MEPPTSLETALQTIASQGAQMRRCLDTEGRLLAAVKYASLMLAELRTSELSPKQYYELYVACFDNLIQLGEYLQEDHRNHHLGDIYEIVQYAGSILPRLYLMITVGSAYLSVPDAPVKGILKDMLEMCRGVQHPLRGLFLRYYLGQRTRDYLPTNTDNPKSARGTLLDSIRFTTTNFVEMNKLWVRIQHQGHSSERAKRFSERRELQTIVGSNIVRLAQLDGLTLELFQTRVLPSILEQLIQSRDVLAQEYLLDVVCQAFPPEFHLATLDLYLGTLGDLNPQTSERRVLMISIDRMQQYVATLDIKEIFKSLTVEETESTTEPDKHTSTQEEPTEQTSEDNKHTKTGDADTPKPVPAGDLHEVREPSPHPASAKNFEEREFDQAQALSGLFQKYLDAVIKVKSRLALADRAIIVESLAKLAILLDKENTDRVHQLLLIVEDEGDLSNAQVTKLLLSLLDQLPLLIVIGFGTFQRLLAKQEKQSQQAIASKVLQVVLSQGTSIKDYNMAKQIFDLFSLITKSGSVEQLHLAELVYLLETDDIEQGTELLQLAHKSLRDGGISVVQQTYSSLVTAGIRLIRANTTKDPGPLLKFIGRTINDIASIGSQPEKAFRLYTSAASIADQVKAESISYEFFVQAFTLYEESISDSRAQYQAICILASALQKTRGFSTENYETLSMRVAMYGQKLLKKPDQCRSIYLASHLWMATELPEKAEDAEADLYSNDDKVLETLQRALRVADASMDVAVSVELFVEVLNRYLYYLDHGSTKVLPEHISSLIDLIKQNLTKHADEATSDSPRQHFERTIDFIKSQVDNVPSFAQIEL